MKIVFDKRLLNRNYLVIPIRYMEMHKLKNPESLAYLESPKLPQKTLQLIKNNPPAETTESQQWNQYLDTLGIKTPKHRAIATEGALLGGLGFRIF